MRSAAESRRAVRLGAATLLGTALLAGCQSLPSLNPFDWFNRPPPPGQRPAELTAIANPLPVRTLWTASVGASGGFLFSPALVGDTVYAAARDGTVAAFEAASGRPRWRVNAGRSLSAGVGADRGLVVVATEEGEVIALDAASGAPRWMTRVTSEVLAPPRLGDGLVYVRSSDSRIFAFGVEDGRRRWVYQRPGVALQLRSPAGMTPVAGGLYAGFSGGRLVAIAAANGGARWDQAVAQPRGTTELERMVEVLGDPAVSGREVCAGAFQGRVACFDAQNGSQVWARDLSALAGVALDGRIVFVADQRGSVHALDRSSGQSLWTQERLRFRNPSQPVALGEAIAVADFQGFVHFLARDSGAFVARAATDGSPVAAAPLRLPQGFLVQTRSGALHALSL